jgi:hypothetical protein
VEPGSPFPVAVWKGRAGGRNPLSSDLRDFSAQKFYSKHDQYPYESHVEQDMYDPQRESRDEINGRQNQEYVNHDEDIVPYFVMITYLVPRSGGHC